jgi:hypothetical protein
VAGILTDAPVADDYSYDATLENYWTARGGSFSVSGAPVIYQLQYGRQGESAWTPETTLTPSTGNLESGTQGIRFRNAVPGTQATVSVYIAEGREPYLSVVAGGQSTPAGMNVPLPLYRPSGDTSGVEDRGQINQLIAADGGAQLATVLPGGTPYYIDRPILLQQDGMSLRGTSLGYPFSNNPPYRSGTVIVAAAGFTGTHMIAVQQAGVPTAALAGIDLRDFTLLGSRNIPVAGLAGIYFQAFRSRIDNVGVIYFDGDGIITEGTNSTGAFPGDASENTYTRMIVNTLAGRGLVFLSATDNLVELPEIANCDGGGIYIDAHSPGCAVYSFYIYATTMMPYGVTSDTLYDVKVQGGRFSGIRQPIIAGGFFYGSDFSHFTAQASNQAGDDGLFSAVTITPNATASYGGNVGPITVSAWPGTNVRFLHGVVIANANAHGWTVLPITDSHAPAIASAMTGARVLDAGVGTRNFDALA